MEEPSLGEKIVMAIGMISTLVMLIRIMTSPGACLPLPEKAEYSAICFGMHFEEKLKKENP